MAVKETTYIKPKKWIKTLGFLHFKKKKGDPLQLSPKKIDIFVCCQKENLTLECFAVQKTFFLNDMMTNE